MDEKMKEIIELAILANGGENWRKDWCQCDPSVGHTSCEYCAIFNGLNKAKLLLSECERLERNKDLQDYRKRDLLIEQLSARVKELEDEIKDIINYSSNYSSNYSAFGRLAEIRDKLKKLIEKEVKEKDGCKPSA